MSTKQQQPQQTAPLNYAKAAATQPAVQPTQPQQTQQPRQQNQQNQNQQRKNQNQNANKQNTTQIENTDNSATNTNETTTITDTNATEENSNTSVFDYSQQQRVQQRRYPNQRKISHPLQYTYSFWFFKKVPGAKISDYEKSIKKIGDFSTVEGFWGFYTRLIRPSSMQPPSDFHVFREGIRPMWEDEANKKGGRFLVRFKKMFSDQYWEDLLLAVVGNRFDDDICGVVISIRELDTISIWTRDAKDTEALERIKNTLISALRLPYPNIEYRPHDESIATSITKSKHHQKPNNNNNNNTNAAEDSTENNENEELEPTSGGDLDQ